MKPPTFLVLGAAKCGTTTLCHALGRHPEVFVSDPKEPVFFEREYERGLEYYRSRYFRDWSGEKAAGEGRVYHLYLPFVARRIRETAPEARLVAILRDPVERTHSHWWHRRTRGNERRSFGAMVEEELARLDADETFPLRESAELWRENFFPEAPIHADLRQVPIVELGHYAEQLRRYFDLFPARQLRVLFFEEFIREQERQVRKLWEFLGVDPGAAVPGPGAKNPAEGEIKSALAFRLEKLSWSLGLIRWIPKPVRTAVRRLLSRSAERPAMSGRVRRRLEDHFEEPNRDLARLLGRELPGWGEPARAGR